MRTKVQMWGNSLALRIPKAFAAETALVPDSEVELRLIDGALVITPIAPPEINLDDLLAGITDDNRHAEIDSGPAQGDEAW